jgi:hypothetical protein
MGAGIGRIVIYCSGIDSQEVWFLSVSKRRVALSEGHSELPKTLSRSWRIAVESAVGNVVGTDFGFAGAQRLGAISAQSQSFT